MHTSMSSYARRHRTPLYTTSILTSHSSVLQSTHVHSKSDVRRLCSSFHTGSDTSYYFSPPSIYSSCSPMLRHSAVVPTTFGASAPPGSFRDPPFTPSYQPISPTPFGIGQSISSWDAHPIRLLGIGRTHNLYTTQRSAAASIIRSLYKEGPGRLSSFSLCGRTITVI